MADSTEFGLTLTKSGHMLPGIGQTLVGLRLGWSGSLRCRRIQHDALGQPECRNCGCGSLADHKTSHLVGNGRRSPGSGPKSEGTALRVGSWTKIDAAGAERGCDRRRASREEAEFERPELSCESEPRAQPSRSSFATLPPDLPLPGDESDASCRTSKWPPGALEHTCCFGQAPR